MGSDNQATPPVDLRQVLYFVTVAEELSFTRAAARLHISTPALSQQVKALERHLAVQLLIRDTHKVRLTAAGEVFAAAGQRLLDEGESTVVQTRKAAGLVSGGLRLASLHEVESVFEPLLSAFHVTYAGIRLTVATMRHLELIAALRDRTVDAALTWSFLLERSDGSEGLQWKPVTMTEVVALIPRESELAMQACVRRGKALSKTSAVVFERTYSPVAFDYVMEQLYGIECPNPPVHEVPVTVRGQETMVRRLAVTGAFAPVTRPLAEMVGGPYEIRPFDPPWILEGCVVWQRVDTSAPLVAFLAAAERT